MKFKNNSNNYDKYFVYGINGVESILNSNKCKISQIIVSDTFNQHKMADSALITKKFKHQVIILNKNEFQNKYQEYRTQGIIVFFDYTVLSHVPDSVNQIDNEFKENMLSDIQTYYFKNFEIFHKIKSNLVSLDSLVNPNQ